MTENPSQISGQSDPKENAAISSAPVKYPKWRFRVGMTATILGFLILLIGARPYWFDLPSHGDIGFVKIATMLIGLALICLGGYSLLSRNGIPGEQSIAAEIGVRLVATGYLISVFTGMADIFGFGSQPSPLRPYFGPLQAIGMVIGELVIAIGFILLLPHNKFGK